LVTVRLLYLIMVQVFGWLALLTVRADAFIASIPAVILLGPVLDNPDYIVSSKYTATR
jgi:hypothetical protein